MVIDNRDAKRKLAKIVEHRAGIGPTDMVSGWQTLLRDLLRKMKPYLKPGAMITFQNLTDAEIIFFERLHHEVEFPQSVVGFYLPPSVRQQMLGGDPIDDRTGGQSDAGVVVASLPDSHDVIVNALFAFPPFTPAVDVYERGQLVAGYQYVTNDACRDELAVIVERHLANPSGVV